jgi:hypothetical protein
MRRLWRWLVRRLRGDRRPPSSLARWLAVALALYALALPSIVRGAEDQAVDDTDETVTLQPGEVVTLLSWDMPAGVTDLDVQLTYQGLSGGTLTGDVGCNGFSVDGSRTRTDAAGTIGVYWELPTGEEPYAHTCEATASLSGGASQAITVTFTYRSAWWTWPDPAPEPTPATVRLSDEDRERQLVSSYLGVFGAGVSIVLLAVIAVGTVYGRR